MRRERVGQALALLLTMLVISPVPFAIAGAGFVWVPMAFGLLVGGVIGVLVRVPSSPLYKPAPDRRQS